LGGSERKLSLPLLQNGTKAAVLILAAIRSGRSENASVIGLTPSNVSLPVALSKVTPFAVCTNRKSAFSAGSSAACARVDVTEAAVAASAGRTANKLRLVVI
jgi:hypothetical protein